MFRISTSVPPPRAQWVVSACHRSLGWEGLESDERALRALLRLGSDEASPGENPPDRGGSGGGATAAGEVEGDGVRPGVEPLFGKLLAHLDDLVFELDRGLLGAPQGTA